MNPRTWSFETGARTIWQEARGEPDIGKHAVAHVLWNRLRAGTWGHTMASVCLSPLQFSGWNDHDPNRMAVAAVPDDDSELDHCRTILAAAQQEPDPTGGALYYYARTVPAPEWASQMFFCGEFGSQLFYKPRP